MSCKQEEMVAFVDGEPEAASDRADHLLRGLGAGAALEAREVVGGHVREFRYFLSAKTGGSAAWAAAEADVFRLKRFAAGPNEHSQRNLIHKSALPPLASYHCGPLMGPQPGPDSQRLNASWLPLAARGHIASAATTRVAEFGEAR